MRSKVYKHIGLIECEGDLGLLERKILNALLFHAFNNNPLEEQHQISVSELKHLLLYDSKNPNSLKKSLTSLATKPIHWMVISHPISVTTKPFQSVFLANYSIRFGQLYYSYPKELVDFCHQPKVYAALCLSTMMRFKSQYSLVLYEQCERYYQLTTSCWYSVLKLQTLLGVPKGRRRYAVFINAILKPALKEINDLTSLRVELVEKTRLKERFVRFNIAKRTQPALDSQSFTESVVFNKLTEQFHCPGDIVIKALQRYNLAEFHRLFLVIEKLGEVQVNFIKKHYPVLFEVLNQFHPLASFEPNLKQQPPRLTAPKDVQETRRRQQGQSLVNALCTDSIVPHRNDIESAFRDSLGHGLFRQLYEEEGFNNALIQDKFYQFVTQTPEVLRRARASKPTIFQ